MAFIGNSRQRTDNEIAVEDALPLSKCWRELRKRLDPSRKLPAEFEPDAELLRWKDTALAGEIAQRRLRFEIANGDLQLWRIHNGQDKELVPCDLLPQSIRSGIFVALNRAKVDPNCEDPPPEIHGARLWVKREHWKSFLSSMRKNQGGKPPQHKWQIVRTWAEAMLEERPSITRHALAESLLANYQEEFPTKPPVKRTIERKLELWNLPSSE